MSSRSITFRQGEFKGWTIGVVGEAAWYGEPARTLVVLETPRGADADTPSQAGLLAFSEGVPGFELTCEALTVGSGAESLHRVLSWVIEASREALDTRSDIDERHGAYWQAIVDRADASREAFFARYPDGVVPPFEVVGQFIGPIGSALAGAQ